MKKSNLIGASTGILILFVLLAMPGAAQPGPDKHYDVIDAGLTTQVQASIFPKPWKYTMNITAMANTTVYMLAYTNASLEVVYNQTVGTANVTFRWEFQAPIEVFTKIQNPNPTAKANVTWYEETEYDEGVIPGPSGALVAGAISVGWMVAASRVRRRNKHAVTS